jgi:hypothetical protein
MVLISGSAVTPQDFHFKSPRLWGNEHMWRWDVSEKLDTPPCIFEGTHPPYMINQLYASHGRENGRTGHLQTSRRYILCPSFALSEPTRLDLRHDDSQSLHGRPHHSQSRVLFVYHFFIIQPEDTGNIKRIPHVRNSQGYPLRREEGGRRTV